MTGKGLATALLAFSLVGCDTPTNPAALQTALKPEANPAHEWRGYLGGSHHNHHSSLDQIKPSNVHQLQEAWRYHAGGELD
ncbi:MAG: hypothetical protein V7746_22555, partial [Halioglobus sp.]